MNRRRRRCLAALLLSASLGTGIRHAEACSPAWTPVYAFTRFPGSSRPEFLRGRLGLISGKWDDATLLVAFRYLEGLPLDETSQVSFAAAAPRSQVVSGPDAQMSWRSAVERAGGTTHWIRQEREEHGAGNASYGYYANCLDDALRTAAVTLDERVVRYGRGTREVAAWLEAQTVVFENCAGGEHEPPTLDDSFDTRLRADRDYQRAAAAFYSGRYALAEERFEALARSPSEWADLAAYLVARAQIRAQRWTAAEARLRAVLADASLARWHASARGLLQYVAARARPEEREAELAQRLFARDVAGPLRQNLDDYLWLIRSARPSRNARSHEFRAWLATLRAESGADEAETVTRFVERPQSLARLIAVLGARAPDPATGERILQAAARVPPSSPGYLAVNYLRAQRLAERGRHDEAREILDDLLTGSAALSTSDRNALRHLRATVAESLEDFVRFMSMPRVGDAFDSVEGPLLVDGAHAPTLDELPPEALYVLNNGIPLGAWERLARAEFVPLHWRRLLALSGFARALVDGADGEAVRFARQAATLDPSVAADLRDYVNSDSIDERRFLAALALLRRPAIGYELGLRFGAHEDLDRWRGNWWCGGPDTTVVTLDYRPRFLGQGATLAPRVPAQPAAVFLGDLVVGYARRHLHDHRVPEALHRVVRATRFGCGLGANGRVSRAAFELLHRRFPASEWTRRTPYWFD